MSFDGERIAIEGRHAANFTALPTNYEGRVQSHPLTGYVNLLILSGDGFQSSLGSPGKFERMSGVIQHEIYVPAETGSSAVARAHGDTIAAIFRHKQFSSGASGTITTRTPSYIRQGDRDGFYWAVVSTPYQRDVSN